MLLRAIIHSIESVAPRSAQEQWDNSGLQVGEPERDIQSVLLTTDVTSEVVDEAMERGCDLIISHHPLLFHPLKQVCGQTPQARIVATAIKHDIAIYSAHTSLDSVIGGINTRLAQKLGLLDPRILVPHSEHEPSQGLGVIGHLDHPVPFMEWMNAMRTTLNATYVRYVPPVNDPIRTIALCGGSGAEFIPEAIAQGADVYLTADCKYHEFQLAQSQIGLVDIDHWASEHHATEIFRDILTPLGIPCFVSEKDCTPISLL